MKREGNRQMIERAAELAELALNEKEKGQVETDIGNLLTYIGKLQEVDTQGIEPLIHIVAGENVVREDVISNGDQKQEMLKRAPQQDGNYYQVPKTLGSR